jgi:hypothetical protein
MSSEGDALGASYSRGERDYAGDATTLADPHVPAGRTGRPGISFLVVSAWATALVALWVYRRAVVRALQAARAGTLKPRAALVHVRSALKSCSAASRRRFAATWSAFPAKPSTSSTLADDPDPDPFGGKNAPAVKAAPPLAVTVDPPGVEDGRWTQHWDVSPRPSTISENRANDDGKTSAASATSGTSGETSFREKKKKSETEDDGKTSAASFPGVETTDARSVARAAADVRFLCDSVPRAHRFDGWRLLYRAARDGFSLKTLYRKCAGAGAVVTLVEDERGGAFGAFTSDAWRMEPRPYGDGRCFVFSLRRDREHGDDGGDAVVTRTAYRVTSARYENSPHLRTRAYQRRDPHSTAVQNIKHFTCGGQWSSCAARARGYPSSDEARGGCGSSSGARGRRGASCRGRWRRAASTCHP